MTDSNTPARKGKVPLALRIIGGGLFGGAISIGGFELYLLLRPEDGFGLAQLGALGLALTALSVGGIIMAMSFSKRLYNSENWTPESDPDEHRHLAPNLRLTGVNLIAIAVEFIALVFASHMAPAFPMIAIIYAAIAVQGWTGWRLWQASDELERAASLRGAAYSLGVVMLLLSLWAPFAIYGFVGFDPLAVIVLATLATIAPTVWVSVKMGLTK